MICGTDSTITDKAAVAIVKTKVLLAVADEIAVVFSSRAEGLRVVVICTQGTRSKRR
jgi:hypothetical protein